MAIISRRLWKQTGREIEFESNTTYVPRSELDEFLSPPPSLGFTENRRNSNPNRGMNFNPGSSGSNSFTHTQNISNPRFETHHAARIPNINPYYGNNSNNN
ncbi:9770_t:CDS:1 [Scutellospora calospora]|uniref:9770_t:CDS:1 n=1 Tax=Scutellospora calospora TaxID=85575 RepID=A0ACA9KLH3_9GLOM|nr:9770_t:CDS:1 [Scutellospora calospora]